MSPLPFGPPTVGPFTIDILGCPQAGATVTLEMQSTWTYATHAMGGVSLVLVSATPAPPGATINGCDILVGASAPWVLPNDDLWKVPCPVGTAASCFSVPFRLPAVTATATVYVQLVSAYFILFPYPPYAGTEVTSNGLAVSVAP